MSDRFAPNSSRIKPLWDTLRNTLKGADEQLIKAFSAVARPKSQIQSLADVQRHLLAKMDMAPTIPWILYDTIAELMRYFPLALRETLAENIKIETGHMYEHLRITVDGNWQIAWEIDPLADSENREVALNWYIPPNQNNVPTVPLAIIDCIASSVLLLREDLVLPAATTLSVALEAALWDALTYSDFSRYSDQITYTPVKWNMRKTSDKLLLSIEGADKSVKELISADGSPATVAIELRKMQARDSSDVVGLKVEVDKKLADFLVSSQEESRERIKDKGFSVAMQKARKEKLRCVEETIPDFLDNTLISLRNNLVHLPSQGKLDQPIPIEGQSGLQSVDELRANPRFVRFLLYRVVDIINTVYADQMHIAEEQTNTEPTHLAVITVKNNAKNEKTAIELLDQSPVDLRGRFEALKTFLLALGKDTQMKPLRTYFAFKRIRNFACVEIHPQTKRLLVYVKVNPSNIQPEKGFTRDVRNIGHYGTGDLEITIRSDEDLEKAKELLTKSYQDS